MRTLKRRLGYFLVRLILSLHYRVKVEGVEDLKKFKHGIVVGLGHVAYIDPPLVKTQLARYGIYARPVAYSKMYDALKWIMRRIGGFRIESLQDGSSDWMKMKIEKTVGEIDAAVAAGDDILIYASGQTKSDLKESLGGKSSTFELFRNNPDVDKLAVHIYGLYGSIWSRYFTDGKKVPSRKHMWAMIKRHPLRFLKPVRVVLKFELLNPPPCESARQLNQYLEGLYHAQEDWIIPGRDKCKVVGFAHVCSLEYKDEDLEPAVIAKVAKHLGKTLHTDPEKITLEQSLEHDLGMDSMALVEMRLWIEEEFGKHVDENADILLVKDLAAAAQGLLGEVEEEKDHRTPKKWLENGRKAPEFPTGTTTIPEAFFAQAERMGWDTVVMGDERTGVLTYGQFLEKACMLAFVMRTYPEPRIGMMLPASVGASIVVFAALLAGKTIVPLNWTNGRSSLDHGVNTSEVKAIFSSDLFLDKASVPLSEETAAKIVVLESLKSVLGLRDLLRAKWLVRKVARVRKYFGISTKPEDHAALLFTSGSESAPKGVRYKHSVVTSNVDGALEAFGGLHNDVMLGFLPPFHSFGFTQIMMLCLVGGVKTVFEPDPKKYKRLALAMGKWKVTLVAGTPDFLTGILNAAEPEMLSSSRAWVSGAQKASATLKKRVRDLGVDFLEGYGITETGPLVCVTRAGEKPVGVGREIKNTVVRIVDLETMKDVKDGEQGLMLVAGPGVFDGYLGTAKNPFMIVGGVIYYNTGDLGRRVEGCIEVTGRLKRFKKYAGEMINITKIEDTLVSSFPGGESGPVVAVEAGEEREGAPPVIALYTADPAITLDEANKVLKEKGFAPYEFVRKLCVLPEIPLLGTGKVNHKVLPNPDLLQ